LSPIPNRPSYQNRGHVSAFALISRTQDSCTKGVAGFNQHLGQVVIAFRPRGDGGERDRSRPGGRSSHLRIMLREMPAGPTRAAGGRTQVRALITNSQCRIGDCIGCQR
jgi:hypothetical protein